MNFEISMPRSPGVFPQHEYKAGPLKFLIQFPGGAFAFDVLADLSTHPKLLLHADNYALPRDTLVQNTYGRRHRQSDEGEEKQAGERE